MAAKKSTKTVRPTDLQRSDIIKALTRSADWSPAKLKEKTGYGASRTYALQRKGKILSAKGIVALACKIKFDGLPGENFSGGSANTAAGGILVNLGFKVTGINI